MARARAGGAGSGLAWALVIFGAGFVICLLLAIIFWAQLSDAREEALRAESALRQFVNANEQNNPAITGLPRAGGATLVGALYEQNRELKQMIAGDAEAPLETIAQQRQELGVNVALLREISSLKSTLADAQQRLEQAEQARQQQQQRAEQALQERAQLAQQYNQSVQALESKISQLNQDLLGHQGTITKLQQQLTSDFGQTRREKDAAIVDLQNQLQSARAENDQLKELLARLTEGDDEAGAKIAQPDGVITGLIPGENRVYINRGARDRVILGMTFEVFEDGDLVNLGDMANDELRGKATVEVIDVRDNSSLARVVRTERGQTVEEGDQLLNLVYDPNATHKFFVYGDFDIENTGQPQATDRQRVESMIQRWGGRIVQRLSYDTDFLVLGAEPPLPEPLPAGVIDPQRIAENVAAQKNFETYQQLIGEAREMNIPVLNQNRFLNLVGFYRR